MEVQPDEQRIPCVCPIRAQLERILFGFLQLLCTLIFLKPIAPDAYPCILHGGQQELIVRSVECREEILAPCQGIIDILMLQVMLHGLANVLIDHSPLAPGQFVLHNIREGLRI